MEHTTRAVQQMHPDPFVQAAILKLYLEAPGLLDQDVVAAVRADARAHNETEQGN